MQLIVIKLGEHLVLEIVHQVRGKQPASLPGIHEPVQLVNQHGAMVLELGYDRLVQGVELPRIHHGHQSTREESVDPGAQFGQSP
jgi:hypothetical protein